MCSRLPSRTLSRRLRLQVSTSPYVPQPYLYPPTAATRQWQAWHVSEFRIFRPQARPHGTHAAHGQPHPATSTGLCAASCRNPLRLWSWTSRGPGPPYPAPKTGSACGGCSGCCLLLLLLLLLRGAAATPQQRGSKRAAPAPYDSCSSTRLRSAVLCRPVPSPGVHVHALSLDDSPQLML